MSLRCRSSAGEVKRHLLRSFNDEQNDNVLRLNLLRVIGSPQSSLRSAFDLMRLNDDADWEVARARLAAVPQAIAQISIPCRRGPPRRRNLTSSPGDGVCNAVRYMGKPSRRALDLGGMGLDQLRDELARL